MASIDVARQRRSLLADATALHHLPPELLELIRHHTSSTLLDAVAQAALSPSLTEQVFVHFEDVFPDICARWILHAGPGTQHTAIAAAFARLLPFAPYLSAFLTCSAQSSVNNEPPSLRLLLPQLDETVSSNDLLQTLVTAWRLLSFDARTFRHLASPSYLQSLFTRHESRAVRLIAIRVFCQLLHASDLKLEALVKEHCGQEDAIIAELDGTPVDFGFLSLHEHARAQRVVALRQQLEQGHDDSKEEALLQSLTPYVVPYGKFVLPRPHGSIGDPSALVMTATTMTNLENLASMLREADPILLHGPPGVGKTALVHEFAKQLGMYSSMVTLHLNEQTDAKMLIGLYSTDSKPGSFQWRPGVLTTAVREGRWVLIEDLDRAPTEVLSTLLPLIERQELLIPTRGERIRAAKSFRLFATVRTSPGINGRENLPSLVGMRFWQSLYTQPPASSELEHIVLQTYPILHKFAPGILAVHERLSHLTRNPALMSRGRSVMDRQMNLRDLLKWCRRLRECLLGAGSTSGDEPISETTRDWMFMEALDCFVGSCPDVELGSRFVYAIAEEMHMSKDRAEHYLSANIPILEENDLMLNIGRAQLRKKRASSRLQKSKRPFASTAHAKKLLEQIAVAVKLQEPVLLVGETGIGKTTVVQQLAESLGHKLIAVNLSQQSEVGDLLGGFKPVNVRSLAVPLKEEFEDLFAATGISASKNQKYLEQIGRSFAKGQWSKLSKLWKEAPKMFVKIVSELERMQSESRDDGAQPTKRRRTQSKLQTLKELRPRWDSFARNLDQFDVQISGGSGSFAFSFVEGNLVKAVRNGDWVLLDEINLASPDTLESIADLLVGPDELPSILLAETGELEKVVAHPNFRIFGAMNPATDIGKRDLPIGIRSRFTELYVRSPDADHKDLLTIVKAYLGSSSIKNDQAADDIARLYLNTKRLAEEKRLVDGANEVPHFSLRTLTRVLSYVNTIAPLYGLRRALYEGFSMGFLTLLDRDSEIMLLPLIYHHLLDKHGNSQSLLSQAPKHPNDGRRYVRFQNQNRNRQYWLFQGEETPVEREDYIITPYVERNLLNLVRATSTRRFPILIQGPTSAGKTSMIEYLANFTGNKFVRINNHEHTDLQEYLGTYVSGSDGKLRFQEGLLVQAMRQGHWIVLDELNLAPTDVLEALNRLLDDNRELLIPETQEVVRPHENFILFATQNPPGLYGGRKILSRAFRNRFLELHFDDIPEDELEYILQRRSRNTSPPDCRRIVTVYKELSRLRQTSRLFEQKDSFATLRDLFRWALREADSREEIAAHGFMLLAERVRNEEERLAVKEIIEKVFKIAINPNELYSADVAPELKGLTRQSNGQDVVWTRAMRRLYVLVSRALRNNEPVLLVGETGCGKTTVCQLLAEALNKRLDIVNAHQNTETGDLIGSQRPVRNRGAILEALNTDLASILETLGLAIPGSIEEKLEIYKSVDEMTVAKLSPELVQRVTANETRVKALFEWSDGALVEAMRDGHFFLLDEISLADDSVLERLNSVLEPQRTLLLAEKGIDNSFILASAGFQFFATMNPGGDFGKKELSPALRNRFTEIWVPPLSESHDIYNIVRTKLVEGCKHLVDAMVQFAVWFGETFRPMATTRFSVREVLAWVDFINSFKDADAIVSLVHGASAIFVDSIGANPSAILATDLNAIHQQRQECLATLGRLVGRDVSKMYGSELELVMTDDLLSIGNFSVPRFPSSATNTGFAFHAPTTRLNAMRVVRALQMRKPILLEGSPGVGKTSLVAALSQACGRPLTRINLSDQTDLMDLFGTDVPVEGEEAGNFAWRDAPFLQAMQKGDWVLLDEMNLASQSVLEGLNACLDHRGEVYISELDQVFKRHPGFRLFAAQNPHHQGGGRKGLPASFVNRFIVVYADVFKDDDLKLIASHNFPDVCPTTASLLIDFVSQIDRLLTIEKSFGSQGGPWEFNLRDILRWLDLLNSSDPLLSAARVDDFLDIIVRQRFRTQKDRDEVNRLFGRLAGLEPRAHPLYHDINSRFTQVGLALLRRNANCQHERLPSIDVVPRLPELESLMICVEKNIPCILSSPSGFGKSTLLTYVAALAGKPLVVFPMNADVDTMDLVGGFEQADPLREVNTTLRNLRGQLQDSVMSIAPAQAPAEALHLLHLVDAYSGDGHGIDDILSAIEHLQALVATDSDIGIMLSEARRLLQGPLILANPQFEWLDGVIVKAIQTGQWLVLDNANMCNASVLDRLNSLLEPNGFLCINEHCDLEGKPKMIKPHPEFRVFLTMDPRYGELSRAMRNRAVEIHIHTPPPSTEPCFNRISDVESGLRRYKFAQDYCQSLSPEHISLLPRLVKESSGAVAQGRASPKPMNDLVGFLQSSIGSKTLQAVMDLYSTLPEGIPGLSNTQPINTFNNCLVTQLVPTAGKPQWTGVRVEFSRLMYSLQGTIERHCSEARSTRLASLTRLQRSFIRDRVAAVSKDSTVKLCAFLSLALRAIQDYVVFEFSSFEIWKERSRLIRLIAHYMEQTIGLSSRDAFDEARFQAHLTLGIHMLQHPPASLNDSPDLELMTFLLRQLESNFNSGFELSTGLSMEIMWHVFRPAPFHDKAVLDQSLELDLLASRFDAVRWKANASILDLSKAHKTLQEAIGDQEAELQPYLARDFEHLRQISMLQYPAFEYQGHERRSDLAVLSSVSTKATMMLTASNSSAATLQSVDCLVHQDIHCWDGKLATSVWQKLQDLGDVSLRSLALLECELPLMGRCISELSVEIATDPLDKLNKILWQLLSQVFVAHEPQLDDWVASAHSLAVQHIDSVSAAARVGLSGGDSAFDDLLDKIDAQHLRQISRDHLIPAVVGIAAAESNAEQKAHFSALAWIQFSVGVVKLYVPDRVFDPQLRLRVELDFFSSLRVQLQDKISALKTLENRFSGQDTSVRIELLEYELSEIGPPPEHKQPVYRPEVSELDRLHTECSNVLKIVAGSSISSLLQLLGSPGSAGEASDVLKLIRFNVQTLVARFSSHFKAYQDMTGPIANALRCLLVGLSLCEAATAETLRASTEDIVQATPFFGSKTWDAPAGKGCRKSFEYLSLVSSMVAVEGLDSLSPDTCEYVFECFHSFFDDWSKKLEAERKAEAERTSMYRFRGTLEDEEEIDEKEFNELFPTYDEDESAAKRNTSSDQVRNISLKVAEAHKTVFLERLDPEAALRDTCMAVGQQIADETRQLSNIDRSVNGKLLATTTILLGEKLDEIQSASVDKSYNFYTNANLPEARKLVSLAQKIKIRFRELQRVDEIGHMQPLADVVQSCDKLLDQVHAEPLAKLIPKVEQLHTLVYEWQFGGWASKIYAVLPLHDALTDTIIRWRRLELTTWANLFDMEEQKCRDDAYSWWFVAYQVVIAVPLSIVESRSELRRYATSLVQSLEVYFSSSIVGQFKTRVALLRQLLSHLYLLAKDHPTLEVICHAVKNFIGYYARYQGAADSAIQTGRAPIERKMKDVLLMASWKDTNIDALRESARKSHQKLFRLVRKFRGVLGRDMKAIIEQGLPDEKPASDKVNSLEVLAADALQAHPRPLNEALPGWLDNHRRLANAGTTVSVLTKITQSLAMTSNAANTVDEFVSGLSASMAELRQETPSILSDETKEKVKHLKTRKRKLLADTLRDLRTMGLKYNLAQDKLAEQESLAVVLASVAPVEASHSSNLAEADYLFHKTLDLAPRARVTPREHSDDLTGAEVGRCIGFVEGMISFALSQRGKLARAGRSCSSLRALAEEFRRLGDFQRIGKLLRRERDGKWSRLLPWLAQILWFAAKLAQVHGKLGQTDVGAVTQELQTWAARVEAHLVKSGDLGKLPAQLNSEAHVQLEAAVASDLKVLRGVLDELIRDKPNFAFILQQVSVWTQVESRDLDNPKSTAEIKDFADAASTLVDTILVAVEGAKKAAASTPQEEDEAGWLKKHDEVAFATIHQLHMARVERSLRHCIQLVQQVNLSEPGASAAAMGVVGLAAPILDQFLTLCCQCVEQGIDLHRATLNMAYSLTKAFTQIASQGFCTPQEKSDEKSGDAGQLESGTGLGEGEGAEDISKDIQPDEDLSELAQEASKGEKEDIEDEKDAVDMADEDLEGEMGSVDGAEDDEDSQSGKDEEDDDGMDEEAGDVDDLDPTAVDEKMWDGDDEKAEKDQQGNKPAGHEQDDEQMVPEETDGQEEKEKEAKETKEAKTEEQAADNEESEGEEGAAQEEVNRQDQNVEENDALELPEEMDLDFNDQASASSDSDDLDAMSDTEDQQQDMEEQPQGEEALDEEMNDDAARQQLEQEAAEEDGEDSDPEERATGPDEVQEEVEQGAEEQEEEQAEDQPEKAPDAPEDQANADVENAAPSDVKSSGLDQNTDSMEADERFQAEAAQQQDGKMGDGAADQEADAGNKGVMTRSQEPPGKTEQDDDAEDAARNDPFRKLGDALEKWHRQQADIQDADADEGQEQAEPKNEAEQGRREFQHLQNDETAADTQAMGTAGDEEVLPVDESMAIEEEGEDPHSRVMKEEGEEDKDEQADKMDVGDAAEARDAETTEMTEEDRTGVKTRQGNYNREPSPAELDMGEAKGLEEEDEGSVEETSAQLSSTHISDEQRPLRDYAECMRQWSEFQSKSHGLSLSLTSQLRLILTPSQSTKLSGSFRTGKRLNIKRIIPYIASSYKRDKIWMRRSVPTKRRYQILLCVDDSKSMGESSSGRLAMESLVMVSRSLTMLEAGQVGVVGFGSDVFTAHELAEPFGADAGAKVLQRFSFSQEQTDIAQLVRQTIDTFRAARRQQSGSGSELWQLALMLSDGLTPSGAHETIRRLLREAAEERIMIVFIIMDDSGKKRGDSVLELKEAKFAKGPDGESRVVIERYLDTFPFQYYLIVHNLDELPSALASLLRTWFAEVAA
ncbi:AAA (dynein-related subfamily) domain-containing protein [Hirsutella rhossiliensis]|uniref:Midasin n=1 Tax=Hirsutella rhossiliensis TaxID=111463 RepID=A0A9P8SMF4_9HYPO|nr:AAA (dynein-related subfamily) domain-containing protein [Hirsutella rhossiliensis]KAH0966800.1 AAA (dynein-related subfamily) domain-containing protein [Hirsutella rhossiliensis]